MGQHMSVFHSSKSVQAMNLKLGRDVISMLKMCMSLVTFLSKKKKKKQKQNYSFFHLANFEVSLQYGVGSLCNQLINSSQSIQASNLKLCSDVTSTLKMCM